MLPVSPSRRAGQNENRRLSLARSLVRLQGALHAQARQRAARRLRPQDLPCRRGRRPHRRDRRPAAGDGDRDCLRNRAGARALYGHHRRLPDLRARRQPASDRRPDRSLHRGGLRGDRPARLRGAGGRHPDRRADPDRRRIHAAGDLHQIHPLPRGDGLHGRHRGVDRGEPAERGARPRHRPSGGIPGEDGRHRSPSRRPAAGDGGGDAGLAGADSRPPALAADLAGAAHRGGRRGARGQSSRARCGHRRDALRRRAVDAAGAEPAGLSIWPWCGRCCRTLSPSRCWPAWRACFRL